MKYILLLIVLFTQGVTAQICYSPKPVIVAKFDRQNNMVDSCDINSVYYMANYKMVPDGLYYDVQKKYVRIFLDRKCIGWIRGRKFKTMKLNK